MEKRLSAKKAARGAAATPCWTIWGKTFPFSEQVEGPLHRHTARDGRLTFLLMANPEQAVLHTKLVERNGLLHALLTGTPLSEQGYVFFGDPVYRSLIGGP